MLFGPTGEGKIDAYITLKSLEPIKKRPGIFSIGGFAINKDGETIGFDWDWSSTSFEMDEQGIVTLQCELLDFNEELLEGREVTAAELVSGELTEIFYECFLEEVDEKLTPLVVTEFTLIQDDKEYSFTKEQLKDYDERFAIYHN